MSATSPLDEEKQQLVLQYDSLLAAMSLSNSERRRLGVRLSGADLRRRLYATGIAIAKAGQQPVYDSAKDFLEANS